MQQPARILLVEAKYERQQEVAWLLEVAGYAVRIEPDVGCALGTAAVFRPDLAIVGGVTSSELALDVIPELERTQGVPVIVIDGPNPDRGQRVPNDALIERVEGALRSSGSRGSRVYAAGDVVLDEVSHLALRADTPIELTRTEFDILRTLLHHTNCVLSKEAIVSAVFTDRPVTPNAVEVHIANLRRKLEEQGPRLIHTVRGVGYVLRAPDVDPFALRRDPPLADRARSGDDKATTRTA